MQIEDVKLEQHVMQRHEAIHELATSLEELTLLHQQMSMLVQEQGGFLDSIEACAVDSTYAVEEAAVQLEDVQKEKKKDRRKRTMVAGALVGCAASGPVGWVIGAKTAVVWTGLTIGSGLASGAVGRMLGRLH